MSLRRKWRKVVEKNLELVKEIISYKEEINTLSKMIIDKNTSIASYKLKIKDLEAYCRELKEEMGSVRTYDYNVLLQDFNFYDSNEVYWRVPDKLPEEVYRKKITELVINKMVKDKVIKFDISSNPMDAVITAHVRLRLLDN